MTAHITKALSDIRSNRFMNLITIITIALSILVVSLFLLFFENAGRFLDSWHRGGRAMVYLNTDVTPEMIPGLILQIQNLGPVETMVFVPKDQALEIMKSEMINHTGFFDGIAENPLPDALEIRMRPDAGLPELEETARRIQSLSLVESVEYGKGLMDRFLKIFDLFRTTGYVMCGIFLLIALFITVNTVQLAFHSRRLEMEILRLVGATEGFIKTPFYVEGLVQGFLGGLLGLLILLTAFLALLSGISETLSLPQGMTLEFLSIQAMVLVMGSSTFLGWFGCYLSLRHILRQV
jgi:cell division transport system permease protein